MGGGEGGKGRVDERVGKGVVGGRRTDWVGSGDLTVRPVCGFQTPWSYLPLGFRTLYSIVLSGDLTVWLVCGFQTP